jgi:uncharacterized protein YodC (DUF2158 family)
MKNKYGIKESDIVRLKSSEIKMIVEYIDDESDSCHCIWLDTQGHVQEHNFFLDCLIIL